MRARMFQLCLWGFESMRVCMVVHRCVRVRMRVFVYMRLSSCNEMLHFMRMRLAIRMGMDFCALGA